MDGMLLACLEPEAQHLRGLGAEQRVSELGSFLSGAERQITLHLWPVGIAVFAEACLNEGWRQSAAEADCSDCNAHLDLSQHGLVTLSRQAGQKMCAEGSSDAAAGGRCAPQKVV